MDKKRLLQDLIDGLTAAEEGLKKKEAEDFIRLYFDTIQQNLLNDKVVKVNGLGTFKLIEVEARNSVNVNTGQSVVIPKHLKLSFLPESSIKDAINKPFADFEPIETTNNKIATDETPRKIEVPQTILPEEEIVEEKEVEEVVVDLPSTKPIKQPGIQEMLEELTAIEKPMKPENPRWPVRTILLVVAGILFLAGLTYWSIESNQSAKKDMTEKLKLVEAYNQEDTLGLTQESVLVETPAATDTVVPAQKSTKTEPPKTTMTQSPKEKKQPSVTPETTKPTTKSSIPSTVVIGSGDRLTLLAQKYYGHKVFWVYIYMENKASISNPNNVPVGTTLRLPEKHPTMMDPNNAASIQKAEELQDRIINQLQTSRSN